MIFSSAMSRLLCVSCVVVEWCCRSLPAKSKGSPAGPRAPNGPDRVISQELDVDKALAIQSFCWAHATHMPTAESRPSDLAISEQIATCGEFQNGEWAATRTPPAEMAGSPQIAVRDRIATESNLAVGIQI